MDSLHQLFEFIDTLDKTIADKFFDPNDTQAPLIERLLWIGDQLNDQNDTRLLQYARLVTTYTRHRQSFLAHG